MKWRGPVFILGMAALMTWGWACGKANPSEDTSAASTLAEAKPESVRLGGQNPVSPKLSSVQPLAVRLQETIEASQKVYVELTTFKEGMFDDGLAQTRFILCAAARLQRLQAGMIRLRMDSEEIASFKEPLRQLFGPQRLVTVNGVFPNMTAGIPASGNDKRELDIEDVLGTLGYSYTRFGPGVQLQEAGARRCADSLSQQLPVVSPKARQIEGIGLARDIAGSIKRLGIYYSVLPHVENRLSEMLSLETNLTKGLQDHDFEQRVASTELFSKVAQHEEFLRQATELLDRTRANLATTKPSDEEVAAVLSILGRKD
jgi:hypothetical protein